jgi:hypothetical protein
MVMLDGSTDMVLEAMNKVGLYLKTILLTAAIMLNPVSYPVPVNVTMIKKGLEIIIQPFS